MKLYENTPDEITEDTILRRAFSNSIVRKIDKENRTIDFVISTEAVDRYRDIVDVAGWDLKNYKKNPVVLFGHHSSIPPIGKALKVWKEDKFLKATAQFMPQDISQFAYSIFRMYEEGFLRAVSVGFRALKWEWIKNEDDEPTGGMRFLKSELLEFSAVPVPANPEALIAARSKGIDTLPFKSWAEEILDNWKVTADPVTKLYGIDRKEMETIRRRAAGAGASFRVPLDVQDQLMKKNLEAIRKAKAARAAEAVTTKITLREVEFDLPNASTSDLKKAGQVTISSEEINGKKVFTVDKADDFALFSKDVINSDAGDFMSLELRESEEEGDDLVLTLAGLTSTIEYELVGLDEEKDLVLGIKMSETAVEPAVAKADDEDEEDEDDKKSDDDESDEDEKSDDEDEDDEKSDDEDDEDEEDDEKSADTQETTDADAGDKAADADDTTTKDEEEEVVKLDYATTLGYIEHCLEDLEESIQETKANKELVISRHTKRKECFLAGYMRELADALDGGITTENKSTVTNKSVTEEQDEGMTVTEATDHIKAIANQIQPLLTELIAQKVNKLKGRLD